MTIRDCVQIEELPAGCKLYYRADGSVVIAGGATDTSRILYAIKPQRNLRDRSCQVQRMAPDTTMLENAAPIGGINGLDSNSEYVSLLPTLFPTLDDVTLTALGRMMDDMAWEIADCLSRFSTIRARHYPLQYIALLLWSDEGPATLDNINRRDGNITTEHLCAALGVPTLTHAMKKLILAIQLDVCKVTFVQSIHRVLQGWETWGHVFAGIKELTLDSFELGAIIDACEQYPALLKARWFRVVALHHSDCLSYDWVDWLQRAHGYVIERNANSLMTIDEFLCCYIRNCKQLKKLIRIAEIEFTEHSDEWLLETYGDNHTFHNLPAEVDTQNFRRLRTAGELRTVAKSLNNCAAGYLHEAVSGYTVFFAYKYDPNDYPWGPLHDDLLHEETGLLALRGPILKQWFTTGDSPDWQTMRRQLIMEFRGERNTEMSNAAWLHLENFLAMTMDAAVMAYRNGQFNTTQEV